MLVSVYSGLKTLRFVHCMLSKFTTTIDYEYFKNGYRPKKLENRYALDFSGCLQMTEVLIDISLHGKAVQEARPGSDEVNAPKTHAVP